jgi:hypothetical protein
MSGENRVSIVLSDEDVKTIRDAVNVLNQKLTPVLLKISADERRIIPKMGDKTVSFVTKATDFASNNLWRSHKKDLLCSLKLPLFIAQICKNYMSAEDIHRTGV